MVLHNEKIIVEILDEVYFKLHASPGICQELYDYFSYYVPNYMFMPTYKNKMWDGKIHLFSLWTQTIYRGLSNYLKDFCAERNYDLVLPEEEPNQFIDVTNFLSSLNLPFEPRDYQISAFEKAVGDKRSLLLSPTGSGKSFILYLIVQYLQKKTLLVVPTLSLVHQMKSDFISYGCDQEDIHLVYQGESKKSDKRITISTWQSIYKMPKHHFKNYEVVIMDEAHTAKANSLKGILEKCTNSSYRIGTTGTLDELQTHQLVLEGLIGPVFKVTTYKKLMDKSQLANLKIKCLVIKHGTKYIETVSEKTYQNEIKYLISNSTRNKIIGKLACSLKGNTLVLFQYVEKHGKLIHGLINDYTKNTNRKVFFVHGKNTPALMREDIRKIVEKETDAIIVASVGVFSLGVNIENLENVVFASPSKSRISTLQSIGRGLRRGRTGKMVLYDIVDDLSSKKYKNYALKHFTNRLKIYISEGFDFNILNINI